MADQSKQLKGQDLMRAIEQEYMKSEIPPFRIGDTLEVGVRIREGERERVQTFTGVCIGRKGDGDRQTFTVRRIVNNEGVERSFLLHSPRLVGVEVVRSGRTRRAKLYYLRNRVGKATRLRDVAAEGQGRSRSRKAKKPDQVLEGEPETED